MRRLDTVATDSAALQSYLQEIAKFLRLAAEQEHELGRRMHQQRQRRIERGRRSQPAFVVSLQQIADKMRLSRDRVCQLESRAIEAAPSQEFTQLFALTELAA